jgi:RNase H-fold protein (predicted Holliday junction resolvase)
MATSVERGKVGDAAGFARLLARVDAEAPRVVVVGPPPTLRGQHGAQARETLAFADRLRAAVAVPVETYDERFTSKLAGGDDAQAAAHLLADWLRWRQAR